MIEARLNHLLRRLSSRGRLVGIALLGLAACAPSQMNANRPSPPPGADSPAGEPDAGSGRVMSEQELQACIDDCAQSQHDNPAETPYDCRAACTEGVMR